MANNASISLQIDLKAFNMGLKTALNMGKLFGEQLNNVLSGKVSVNTGALDSALAKYEKDLAELNKSELDIDTKPAETSLTRVHNKAKESSGGIISMFKRARAELSEWGFAIRGVSSLMTTAGRGVEFLVGAARDVESLKLRLVGMYQDAELAAQAYDKFLEVAKKTPETLEKVTQAGATLKAFGMDAEATLTSAVDLASYMGMDLVEAASAMGRSFQGGVGASEIFRERGVLALIKSFSGIEDLTKLTLPEFRKVMLQTLTDPSAGIAGSAERVAKSLAGTASNFSDAMYRLRESVGNGILPVLTKLLSNLTKVIDVITGLSSGTRWMLVLLPLITVLWYNFSAGIVAATASAVTFSSVIGTLQLALSKFLLAMNPVGIILSLATAGVIAYTVATSKAKTETDKAESELAKSKKTISENAEQMKVLTERLGELRSKTKLSTDEQKEKRNIVNTLNASYGEYLHNIDLEKDGWDKVSEALSRARDRMVEYQMAQVFEDRFKAQLKTVAELRIKLGELQENAKKGAFNQDFQNTYEGGQGDVQKYWDQQNAIISSGIASTQKQLSDAENKLKQYNAAWASSIKGMGTGDVSGGDGKGGDSKPTDSKGNAWESFYREMQFRAAGYYEYMLGVYEKDKTEFIRVTGDKAQAEAQYNNRVIELNKDKQKWEAELAAMSPEEQANLKAKNDAVDKYYSTVKFAASDYYDYQVGLFVAERMKYEELTGDKIQAEAQYIAQLKKLDEDKAAWDKNQIDGKIAAQRQEFNQRQSDFDTQISRLENWKSLGIGVSDTLTKLWTEYYEMLKEQARQSAEAYRTAEQNKTSISAQELKLRKEYAEQDEARAIEAGAKISQINMQNGLERKRKWEDENRASVKVWEAMVSGFSDMWNNMTDKTMTGAEKWKSAWNTMARTVYDTLGNIAEEWLKNLLYRLATHKAAETSMTVATAEAEATRTGIVGTSLAAQLAMKIAGAIKAVGIYLFETAAAIMAWYAKVFGPLAPLMMVGTMGVVVKAVNAFRKGFYDGSYTGDGDPRDVAGVVHKSEYVFESGITKGNLPELGGLRAMLQKGYKLKDLLLPSINLQYAPVPAVSGGGGYYSGGYAGGNNNLLNAMQEMLKEQKELRKLWQSGTIKSKMSFSKREMALSVEQGNRERKVIR